MVRTWAASSSGVWLPDQEDSESEVDDDDVDALTGEQPGPYPKRIRLAARTFSEQVMANRCLGVGYLDLPSNMCTPPAVNRKTVE